jgi:hypothetical protein
LRPPIPPPFQCRRSFSLSTVAFYPSSSLSFSFSFSVDVYAAH